MRDGERENDKGDNRSRRGKTKRERLTCAIEMVSLELKGRGWEGDFAALYEVVNLEWEMRRKEERDVVDKETVLVDTLRRVEVLIGEEEEIDRLAAAFLEELRGEPYIFFTRHLSYFCSLFLSSSLWPPSNPHSGVADAVPWVS